MLGAVVVAAGYGLGVVLMSSLWQLVLVSALIGAGIGLAYGAMPALIMGAVPVSETAAANSLNTLMRSIGTSIASAVAGVVLAADDHLVRSGGRAVPGRFPPDHGLGAVAALGAFAIAAFIPVAKVRRGRSATGEPAALAAASR